MKKRLGLQGLAAATVMLAGAEMSAQIIRPPTRTLQAPVRVAPLAGVYAYDYNNPNTSFVWNQYPYFSGLNSLLPNHFLVCFRQSSNGVDCTHSSAAFNVLPGSLQSSLLRNPGNFAPTGTQYRFTPVVPDDRLDQMVGWQVAGCTSPDDASCRLSPHTWIVLSTMDPQAVSVGTTVTGREYTIEGYARNRGSRETRPMTAQLLSYEVLIDPISQDCLRNPNDPAVRNDTQAYVIDSRGSHTQFAVLPRDGAGNYVVSDVVGIYRPGGTAWASQPLTNLVLPALTNPPPRYSVGEYTIEILPETYPRAFVHQLLVDYPGQIDEANELDNSIAECKSLRAP